ncbi:MAG: PAS domain-containing protein [Verrucomicrobia bacterium]|nr:PAS domain-containing protein [Verrucomicrobiota bacterium]
MEVNVHRAFDVARREFFRRAHVQHDILLVRGKFLEFIDTDIFVSLINGCGGRWRGFGLGILGGRRQARRQHRCGGDRNEHSHGIILGFDGSIVPGFLIGSYSCPIFSVFDKQIEPAITPLQRHEALVRALAEIVYEGCPSTGEWHWDGDFTRLLKYSAEEMGCDPESWRSRVHPDDLEFQKPYKLEDLARVVRACLDARPVVEAPERAGGRNAANWWDGLAR